MAFFIEDYGVKFSFCKELKKNGDGFYTCEVEGEVPVPVIEKGDRIILPVDEGIVLTAEDEYEDGEYGFDCINHNMCCREATMSMFVIERNKKFLLIALDNGINSQYTVKKENGLYTLKIVNGNRRKVYYRIFENLVSACKEYVKIKKVNNITVDKKAEKNPEINKLIGGGIFWIWNGNYDEVMYSDYDTDVNPQTGEDLLRIAEELNCGGVDKAAFGIFFEKDAKYAEELYNKYGYISIPYDNYNDVLNPEMLSVIPNNRVKNCDYTARRMKDYPDGTVFDKNGKMTVGWALKGFDGNMYFQNCLCPTVARERMKTEIAELTKKYPYIKGRFIDVFGGGLTACANPEHPLTEEESLKVKKSAFDDIASMGLITGTEDGFEDLIDVLVYTEGLHSPIYFRNNNAGRRHANMYDKREKEHIAKHMLNPKCRIPLWQAAYHECMLTFPYWGDSIDDCIEQIKDKILFACLFGCPPLYSFKVGDFAKLKEHILYSYKKISYVHEKVAALPMTDWQVLSEDYLLQTSVFGERYRVVANFSDKDTEYCGKKIYAKDYLFFEI